MTISFDKVQQRKIELWAVATGNGDKIDDKDVLAQVLVDLVTEKLNDLRAPKGEAKP